MSLTRLGHLICRVDDTIGQLAGEGLTEGHVLHLDLLATHLELALSRLQQIGYELEHRGRLGAPPIPLTAAEARRAA